ncbi:unnamed protein product [Cyprideis torosa]|uniref:Uncharacterized protein n=1 Tax=Cyprideis torosa TaxID=163714 RepID=A0A7R8W5X4_9CRUS|nr:unnamed protein product [Cyprideis torosa]CAG0883401.1 unnamed protein product [Cyprideis torosa]
MSQGSGEDVLLLIRNVKHKKNDGAIYVMNERIAWMQEGKESATLSYKFADIKVQKISPEHKPKVQLQLLLHNGESVTFHFVNPGGRDAQVKDREELKETLSQLLPKFGRKVDRELEEKNAILSSNPSLLQLYKELVITQIVTAEEFWAQHAQKYTQKATESQQKTGISAAFLADVRPQSDSGQGIQYNITPEIIEAVFRTYPSVQQKHLEYVPHKISEQEFWTKFFQSHYFHRDRTNFAPKDVFAECARDDESDFRKCANRPVPNPLIDLNRFDDSSLTPGDGYGEGGLEAAGGGGGARAAGNQSELTLRQTNQSMIRRFNHHSMMVVKACEDEETPSKTLLLTSPEKANTKNAGSTETTPETASKRARLMEATTLEDLQEDSGAERKTQKVSLHKKDRYLQGPDSTAATTARTVPSASPSMIAAIQRSLISWEPNPSGAIKADVALKVTVDLSTGGKFMTAKPTPPTDMLSEADRKELSNLYISLGELLRHFWSCFPTDTPLLVDKVHRMKDTLAKFMDLKVKPFQNHVLGEGIERRGLQSQGNPVAHLMSMLNAAFEKYATWKEKLPRSIAATSR